MNRADADVIVVGGGPAGAATAIGLARRGVDVLLLEKARFPREKPCAEFYSPGVVVELVRLGVFSEIERFGAARPEGMRVSTPRHSFLLSYASLNRALGLPRSLLDELVLRQAREVGTRVREECQVVAVLRDGARVDGVRARVGREEIDLHARFVVGADGLNSAVARALGIEIATTGPARLGLVARYAEVAAVGAHGEMLVGRGRYCGIAPVGNGLVNVGLVVPLGEKAPGEALDRFFDRELGSVPGVREILSGGRRATRIRGIGPLARQPRQVAGPGFLLVGDAAGFLDPFTGEGVYRALRGGELAASTVHAALAGGDDPTRAYLAARHKAFGDKAKVCAIVQRFLRHHRGFDYVARNLASRPHLVESLAGVLGDVTPAARALRPQFLWSLLRPI